MGHDAFFFGSQDIPLGRWNEWGRSLWELQLEHLKSGTGLDWRFAAYVSRGDDEVSSGIDSSISWIEGKIFKETLRQLKVFWFWCMASWCMKSLGMTSWCMKYQWFLDPALEKRCNDSKQIEILFFASPDLEEWWDDSDEAGPKTRTKTDFTDPKPSLEILSVSGGKLKTPGHLLNVGK